MMPALALLVGRPEWPVFSLLSTLTLLGLLALKEICISVASPSADRISGLINTAIFLLLAIFALTTIVTVSQILAHSA
jgi:hypothetical protein